MKRNVLIAIIVLVHAVLVWMTRSPGISWGEDDAQYIVLAREMQHGDYVERWDMDAPVHARLPPGLPALLAISNTLFGESLAVHTLVILLCSAASIVLLFLVVQRHFGDSVAVFVAGLTAINVLAISDAGTIMAEAPFRLWATLVLWAASREHPRTFHIVMAVVGAALAALTRSIGVAVVAALAVHWLLERRWKAIGALAVGSVPVVLWFYWTSIAPDPLERALYLQAVLSSVPDDAQGSIVSTLVAQAQRVAGNIAIYLRQYVPAAMTFFGLKNNPIDNVAWLGLVVLTAPIGLWTVWKRWRLLVLVLGFYAGILAVWLWRNERFVSPVTSMLYVVIAAGVVQLSSRWSERTRNLALVAVASLFIVGSFQTVGQKAQTMLACDRSRTLESPSCFSEDRRGYLQLARYVRDNTEADALFYVPKEGAFYYHTGRKTVRGAPFDGLPIDVLGSELRRNGISYTVVTPIGVFAQHNTRIAQACREFEKVATFEGDAVLLRVRPNGPIDHDDETCQVISQWKDGRPPRWPA